MLRENIPLHYGTSRCQSVSRRARLCPRPRRGRPILCASPARCTLMNTLKPYLPRKGAHYKCKLHSIRRVSIQANAAALVVEANCGACPGLGLHGVLTPRLVQAPRPYRTERPPSNDGSALSLCVGDHLGAVAGCLGAIGRRSAYPRQRIGRHVYKAGLAKSQAQRRVVETGGCLCTETVVHWCPRQYADMVVGLRLAEVRTVGIASACHGWWGSAAATTRKVNGAEWRAPMPRRQVCPLSVSLARGRARPSTVCKGQRRTTMREMYLRYLYSSSETESGQLCSEPCPWQLGAGQWCLRPAGQHQAPRLPYGHRRTTPLTRDHVGASSLPRF